MPPLDLFNGDMSLKYVFQTEFRTVLSNPNTSFVSDYDTQLGSVGYFDESFNGFESNYTVSNLVYSIGGNTVDRIEIGAVTNVTLILKSSTNSFTNDINVIAGTVAVQDSSKYSNSDRDFNYVWAETQSLNFAGNAPSNRNQIRNYSVTYVDDETLGVVFDVEFFSIQKAVIENNQDYVLYFIVENPLLTTDTSDKLTGIIDVNYYYENSDVSGLFDFDKLEQYPHPEPFEEGVTTGFTNALTFNESGMMADGRFWVLNSATLNSLKFDIAVFELNNNTWDSLRSLEIDLSDQTLVDGKQQIELDSTRGYILDDGDIFNYLKITTDTNDGSKQYYNIQVGYKIPWQSWNAFKNAPTEFFDKTKSLNGLNQKASNYSLRGDTQGYYGIKVLFDAVVDSTNYVKTSEEIRVYDYDNQNEWTCEIQTYKKDYINEGEFIPIEGNIIQNDYTQVQAVFTPLVPPVFTKSVDFTEVSTLWNRFAHGTLYNAPNGKPDTYRLTEWANDQANDTDEFTDTQHTANVTKNSPLYNSPDANTILSVSNQGAYYGCYSLDKYENYEINGNMYSNETDNDSILYSIAFNVDPITGVENTLSLVATTGGLATFPNPNYDNNPDNDIFIFNPTGDDAYCTVALVYNYGKADWVQLDVFHSNRAVVFWSAVGDLFFDIKRSGDTIEVVFNWDLGVTIQDSTFNYNLNDNEVTKKFKGFQNISFGFHSQADGGFKDVVLSRPDGDYYSIIRIEPKNSQSDNVINEISSMIEAPENNLLTQITGEEKLATLEYDSINERFICKCLVDTSQIQSGQEYDFSTEIRPRNLEA